MNCHLSPYEGDALPLSYSAILEDVPKTSSYTLCFLGQKHKPECILVHIIPGDSCGLRSHFTVVTGQCNNYYTNEPKYKATVNFM